MTEKEALKWLKDHVEWYEKEYQFPNPNNEQVAVYKVAIKALERDTDDLADYSDKLWQKAYERGKAERLQVIRKDLESWLYEIAMNNFGNELERSCIEIISRLDGFERYVKEKEAENES